MFLSFRLSNFTDGLWYLLRGRRAQSVLLPAGSLHRTPSGLLSDSARAAGPAVHDRVRIRRYTTNGVLHKRNSFELSHFWTSSNFSTIGTIARFKMLLFQVS